MQHFRTAKTAPFGNSAATPRQRSQVPRAPISQSPVSKPPSTTSHTRQRPLQMDNQSLLHLEHPQGDPSHAQLPMSKVSVISPKGFRAILSSCRPGSRVIPVDATWYMPNSPHNGRDQFLNEERLPNAAFFDLDAIALQGSKFPHMLPDYDLFRLSLSGLGIRASDKLVVYDKEGLFSSPRVAWNLALFNHKQVYLLDNYAGYKKSAYPVDQGAVASEATSHSAAGGVGGGASGPGYEGVPLEEVRARYTDQVIEYDELLELVALGRLANEYVTFDARSTPRFTGEAPEPRPGLLSGHVPSALSLPFTDLLNQDKSYKSKPELVELFKSKYNLDFESPDAFPKEKGIIVMCGTGVTAVIVRLAIESVIGSAVPIRVYDGSWTEWAQRAPAEYIVKDV